MKTYITLILTIISCSFSYSQHLDKDAYDSLNIIDTVIISTDYYDEGAIFIIDSICKKHENILQKMPVPIFVRPEGGKMIYLNNEAYAIEYDSINKFISINHYREKLGTDTLGDVVREIFYYESEYNFHHFKVKYSNYKTGELLMLVLTEYYTVNTNITYFSNNRIVKIETHSMLKYNSQDSRSQSHIYSYYKNMNLVAANVISPCKIKSIQIAGNTHYISFDQCIELSLMTRLSKKQLSKKSLKKADKIWVKQK